MLAVAGGKGGTGKTTTALGLAAALARRGSEPVVADTDRAMPNLHVAAETPREPGVAALASGRPLDDATHRSPAFPGVRILSTVPDTDERTLRRTLSVLPGHAALGPTASPIVLDCPSGAGRDAALPLEFADRTVVVSTPRRASLVDAAKTAAMARALDATPVGCVLTRASSVPAGTERILGCPVLACVPAVPAPLSNRRVRRVFERLANERYETPGTFNRMDGLRFSDGGV